MRSDEYLDSAIERFEGYAQRLEKALAGITEADFNTSKPGKYWNRAQICRHLLISHNQYEPLIAEGLKQNRKGPNASVGPTFMGSQIAKFAGPDQPNTPAPKTMQPGSGREDTALVEELVHQTRNFKALAMSCRGLDLMATRVANPVAKVFQMNFYDVFEIPLQHLERHVRQIEQF